MDTVLTPEGTLALAIAALVVLLGWRFTLPERARDPLYVGLGLVLAGQLVRAPSQVGALAVVVALAQYGWLALAEERDAKAARGSAWEHGPR